MKKHTYVVLAGLLAAGMLPVRIAAQSPEELNLTVGQTILLQYPADIGKVYYSTPPEVIEAQPTNTRELIVSGKALGATTLIVWNKTNEPTFYNVHVDLDTAGLRKLLKETFPDDDIQARNVKDTITLSGSVNSKDTYERATALAASFAKAVVNNLTIKSGPVEKQVLLRVKFALLDRSKAAHYGINLSGTDTPTKSSPLHVGPFNTDGAISTGSIPLTDAAFSLRRLDLNLQALIKASQGTNLFEILAEPNLVASNGKEAYFNVGGEIPIPVPQSGSASGAITIQYHEFGIRLKFKPEITTNNTIKLGLFNEVSAPDYSNATTIGGATVPGFQTRRAETSVELGDGQSYVVAGLLDRQANDTFSKIPGAANLPVLGELFKKKDNSKSSSELIMMVTPEITMPLSADDPKPELQQPVELLKRMDLKDIQPDSKPARADSKSAKKTKATRGRN